MTRKLYTYVWEDDQFPFDVDNSEIDDTPESIMQYIESINDRYEQYRYQFSYSEDQDINIEIDRSEDDFSTIKIELQKLQILTEIDSVLRKLKLKYRTVDCGEVFQFQSKKSNSIYSIKIDEDKGRPVLDIEQLLPEKEKHILFCELSRLEEVITPFIFQLPD